MKNPLFNRSLCACAALLALAVAATSAQEPIAWTAQDIDAHEVTVPAADRPTVILFVMAGQERSRSAMEQTTKLVGEAGDVQVIAVVSGEAAPVKARTLLEAVKWRWPIVADSDYAASGQMNVHAWPTTLVIGTDGQLAAHLAGLTASFTKDLDAYLRFAHGKLGRAGLDAELASHRVVASEPEQAGSRYLHVAQRLLEQGQTEMARLQLAKGLELSPDDPQLKLAMVNVLLARGKAGEALALLEGLDATPAQVGVLRGRALVALGNIDEAEAALTESLRLNPDPAMAYFFLGRVRQAQGQWEDAAKMYRAAFEHSVAGRDLGPTEKAR